MKSSTSILRPEILVGDDIDLLDGLSHERTGTADGGGIERLVLYHGVLDRLIPRSLPDHPLQAQADELRCIGVHAVAGGRTGGAEDLVKRANRPLWVGVGKTTKSCQRPTCLARMSPSD